jgi:DNA-binding HxlR family transcriptional regulator
MLIFHKTRYQDFLDSPEKISTNILADRLLRLQQLGIITKTDDPDNKKQFIYAPTAKGIDLLPVLFDLARWGIKHDPRTDLKHPLVPRFVRDEEKWSKEIRAVFKRPKNSRRKQSGRNSGTGRSRV